jgi:hypothetical protein
MKQLGQNITTRPDGWSIPVFNTTGETVPPYGVMQIAGASLVGDDTLYHIIKPTGSANAKYVINSPADFPSQGYGFATDLYPADAATIGIAIAGQEWGPIADSWRLAPNGKGFLILGGIVLGLARVASIPPAAGQGADFPVIHIRNDSGLPRPKWSVWRVGTALTPPPDAPIQPTFASLAPQEGEPFVVSFADVGVDPENNIVDAAPVGIVAVQIDYTDLGHKKAECITGDYAKLKSVDNGPATIEWREKQHLSGGLSLGLQWAFVLLDRQGGAGSPVDDAFTAEINSSIAKGTAEIPTSGEGEVFQVFSGGATVSLGVKSLYNPFEFEISGNCSVGRISEDHYLILGDIQAACTTKTVVTSVQCVNGDLVVTTEQITYLNAPCPT